MAEFDVNHNSLTVTSVMFKPTHATASEWVDRIFGSKAVYNRTRLSLDDSYLSFQKNFHLPAHAIHSKCSIELLGFAKLGVSEPFMTSSQGLNIGNASVVLAHRAVHWHCFYRGVREDWRLHDNYWPVLFTVLHQMLLLVLR